MVAGGRSCATTASSSLHSKREPVGGGESAFEFSESGDWEGSLGRGSIGVARG